SRFTLAVEMASRNGAPKAFRAAVISSAEHLGGHAFRWADLAAARAPRDEVQWWQCGCSTLEARLQLGESAEELVPRLIGGHAHAAQLHFDLGSSQAVLAAAERGLALARPVTIDQTLPHLARDESFRQTMVQLLE